MYLQHFTKEQLGIVSEALDIAEDMTSNYYQLSMTQWKRHPFDLKTLKQLFGEDIRDDAFALLKKYRRSELGEAEPIPKGREFYIICLQDHHIIRALKRDHELKLLPLLAYVLTHELVHIVRFCTYKERFDVTEEVRRSREEQVVHQTTYEILKELSLPNLSHILSYYTPSRMNIDICMF
ncbi:MAG: hypothetical protein DRG87_05385 [Deltaproteobacteria bacterium]|nr:hypothetical protein [Deltaproteobacteria bacterium]MBW2311345.1 hypothetical protein [Deltaproteobacteria bacterium]RLB30342.1 MAG: hypothetical protein DRG87_05385 [Deltaproteobacteria bacterium]